MKERKYTRDECGEIFITDWTEEEALAEMKDNGFGSIPMSKMAQVCDVCYEEIMNRCGKMN